MNILIVGNGFDLSHYLPTKYDHFMDVMGAIEKKNTGSKVHDLTIHSVRTWMEMLENMSKEKDFPDYSMNFDELFSEIRESYFIEKTKEYYLTEQIKLDSKDVLKLQYRLELNCWYQYFKNHVEEIKTWIDFEQKIEEVLAAIAECINLMEQAHSPLDIKDFFDLDSRDNLKIKEKNFKTLNLFDLWQDEEYVIMATEYKNVTSSRPNLNLRFCHGEKLENGFNSSGFMSFLHRELEDFISIFNQYLELIVSNLSPSCMLNICANEWQQFDLIYSFNYTNTYQRMHDSIDVEYLHGSHGEYQNIVLGVSDLVDENLKKLKAYGFTKYHQKLFKDTDYLFLDNYKKTIKENKIRLKNYYKNFNDDSLIKGLRIVDIIQDEIFDLDFYIWGHSLDVSDKEYIFDLFSLNDDMDRNVRVTVYHFNKTAKFDLLNNLLAVLAKDKVEHWMKNKWLQFKENPKIVLENAITSED